MHRVVLSLCLVIAIGGPVYAVSFDPDLSLYFDFETIDGDTIPDMSGNGNNGLLPTGTDLEDGVYGSALVFAAGVKIELDGANFVGTPEEAVTMALWLNPDALGTQEIFDCLGTGHGDGQYHFEVTDGGGIRWFHRDDTSTTIFDTRPAGVVADGEWTHIVGVYDGSNGIVYINGEEALSAPGNGNLSTDWAVSAGMGQHKGGRQLLGLMDEFYMFKRALTADEIGPLMDGEFGPFLAVEPGGKLTTSWGMLKSK